jgi:Tfp pilus assembly protein PilF
VGERRPIVLGLLLAALTFVVYLPVVRNGWVWDDDMHVTGNVALRSLDGLRRIWVDLDALPQYYPLVHTTFWIEYRLWRLDPLGYHLVNVGLHAASALLAWRALRGLSVPGAWCAAAAFALHPVHVESVAWVTERKNLLSGLLYLAALLAFLRGFGLDDGAHRHAEPRPRVGPRVLGTVLYAGALLSKTVTCTLPAALLLLLGWKRGRAARGELALLLALAAAGAAGGLTTVWLERHHVGARGEPWDLGIVERGLIAGRAFWFYLGKLVWPARLAFVYPRWEIDPRLAGQYVPPLAALALVLVLWRLRARWGKGPLVATLYFALTLAPALGFFDVYPMKYSFVADHFQYLASLGPIALVSALAARVAAPRIGPARRTLATALVLAALGSVSWRQAAVYRDAESLWRDTLAKNSRAWLAHNNLGMLLVRQGRAEEGARHLREAVDLAPDVLEPRLNLGEVLERQGRAAEALAVIAEAVRRHATSALAHHNLGTALAKRGRLDEAAAHLAEAVRLDPDLVEARRNLATVLQRGGKLGLE